MNRKYFLFILQFLTSICIVSVGFASWTIVSGVSIEESGTISAEDVTQSTTYIEITQKSPLKYYQTGFVTGEEGSYVISEQGTLSFNCKIKIDNCKNFYSDIEELKVTIYLKTNHNTIFSDLSLSHTVDGLTTLGDLIQDDPNIKPTVYFVTFNIDDLQNKSGNLEYTLNINFTIESLDDFNDIYSYLDEVKFETSGIIEEVE